MLNQTGPDREPWCRQVNSINASDRCQFVQDTDSCHHHKGYFDYIHFIFCAFQHQGTYGAVAITVLWLIVLFIALGVTADDFLCPALVVISKTLRLSQNIAGVTFLAFGNGAPDIFSSLAGIQQARSDLVIGELFGAGIFVTTIVAGSICLGKPFKIMERPFLRDVIFYIWATYWAFCLFYSHKIRLRSAAGFVALYGAYIVVVIVSRLVYQRSKSKEVPPSGSETPAIPSSAPEAQSTPTRTVQLPTPPCTIVLTPPESNEESAITPGPFYDALTAPDKPTLGFLSFFRTLISKSNCLPSGWGCTFSHNLDIDGKTTGPGITQSLDDERRLSIFKRSALDDPEAEGVVLRRFSYRTNLSIPRKRTLSHLRSGGSSPTISRRRSISDPVYVISSPVTDEGKPKRPPLLHQHLSTTSLASLISKGTERDLIRPWKDFAFQLCPIDTKGWPEMKWYSKALEVVKAPVFFLLALTTPVVDYEADQQNWCKYISILHCFTGPIFVCLCTNTYGFMVNGVMPLWAVILIVSFALAVLVFFTSIVDQPPKYHAIFAYLGFAVSVTWIYSLAHEIVALLQAIGIVFNLSDTILGLTVLAWGNSIGDYISNTSVARQGFPRMGISACYGGPLLNLLLGIGVPYTVALVQTGSPLELEYTKLVSVLYAALSFTLVSTLLTMTLLRFEVKRFFGGFLVFVYFTFLTIAILVETGVL